MQFKRIKNHGDSQLYILTDDKRRIALDPGQEMTASEDIAGKFFAMYPSLVRPIEVQKTVNRGNVAPVENVYFANLSGNPAAPEMLTRRVPDHKTGAVIDEEYANPIKKAREAKMRGRLIQTEFTNQHGTFTKNERMKDLVFPPFQRTEVSPEDAFHIESMSSKPEGRLMKRVRGPSDFEPNYEWDYEDIVIYTNLMDDSIQTTSMKGLKDKAKGIGGRATLETKLAAVIAEAKHELLTRIFFHLIDDKVRLPTYEEFMSIKHPHQVEEPAESPEAVA